VEWLGAYAAVNINEVIRELLALRANQEELTKRITRLEMEMEALADRERDRFPVRYVRGEEL
jgi:hypothetical protein